MKNHHWFQNITLLNIVSILIFYRDRNIIYYETWSGPAKIAANFINSFFKGMIRFSQYDFQVGVKDKSGKALFYKVEKRVDILTDEFLKDLDIKNWLPKKYLNYDKEWINILKSSLIYNYRLKIMFFLGIENYYLKKIINSDDVKKIILYTKDIPTKIIDSYRFEFPKSFVIKRLISLRYKLMIYPLPGIVIYFILKSIIIRIIKKRPYNIPTDIIKQGCIFEQYNPSLLKRYPDRGHLFWFPYSNVQPDRVVMYFDRLDSPANNKFISEVESYNFSWIDINNISLHINQPIKIIFQCINNLRVFFSNRFKEPEFWIWQHLLLYSIKLEFFREIFRKYNVKALHQHIEWTPETIIKAIALKMETGIMVWNHWSIDRFPVAWVNCGVADLVFSWGQLNDGYFNSHNFRYKYLVQTGMVAGDQITSFDKIEVQKIKSRFSNSVNTIITLFDSSYDKYFYHSLESMLEFYEKILNYIVKDEKLGLIIKSKSNYFNNLPIKSSIHDIINELESSNRCIILDGIITKPSLAASASDICFCYGINTVGIFAGLSGVKSLHFDLSGNIEHPLYYLGLKNKGIFKSLDYLIKLNNNEISNIGDLSSILYLFDTFQDGKGNERAGRLLGEYIRYCDKGLGRDLSLKKAVSDYSNKWGKDKVSSPENLQRHLGNDLWTKVFNNI